MRSSPEGNDQHIALLQRKNEVLGRQGTGLPQIKDDYVGVDLQETLTD